MWHKTKNPTDEDKDMADVIKCFRRLNFNIPNGATSIEHISKLAELYRHNLSAFVHLQNHLNITYGKNPFTGKQPLQPTLDAFLLEIKTFLNREPGCVFTFNEPDSPGDTTGESMHIQPG